MLDRTDISKIKSLFNEEYSVANARTNLYDRIPQGSDGYEGEIRHVAIGDRAWTFHRINKRWWSRELGSALIERWDDVRVPFSNVRVPAASAPSWTSYKGSQVLAFSASQVNNVFFVAQLPHGRKDGSPIDPHIHWVPSNANAGNVRFQHTYSWANVHGVFPAETTLLATAATQSTADQHLITDFGMVQGKDKTLSSMLLCSLSRLGNDAADTYGAVIYIIEFDFHVLFNDMGSINEYEKELIRIGR